MISPLPILYVQLLLGSLVTMKEAKNSIILKILRKQNSTLINAKAGPLLQNPVSANNLPAIRVQFMWKGLLSKDRLMRHMQRTHPLYQHKENIRTFIGTLIKFSDAELLGIISSYKYYIYVI
ncbi:hypothetical protein ACTXT7_014362 [Hymenolepis weldensis]